MQFIDKLTRPAAPDGTEQGKVIILEEEEGDASLFIKAAHLAHDLDGLARAYDPSRRGSIERMNRAERAGASAPTTGEHRHYLATQHSLWFLIALWIRQLIQVFNHRPRRRYGYLLLTKIRKALNVVPASARANCVRQLKQRQFAFKANHAVEFGNEFKRLLITQTGKMSAHGEVAINAAGAQGAYEPAV